MGVNSLPWYYHPAVGTAGETVILEGEEWHHAYKVVRLREHDEIILCDGQGLCMQGTIRSTSAQNGRIVLTKDLSDVFADKRTYKVIVGLAPTKNIDRTEFAIEKMTEMGVNEIFFLESHHSERTHLRLDRMQKILVAAAKQSRKIVFPKLHDLRSPSSVIEFIKKENPDIDILTCHLDEETKPLGKNYLPGSDVVVLIGPEGGFSGEEILMMQKQNIKMTSLGPFRLRVETAAIAACAGIHLINEMNSHT